MSRVEDFVKAGQVAQRVVDRLTPQLVTDAAALSSRLLSVVRLLDDAAGHRAHRRHTNAATLEQLARKELRQLGLDLETHFRRFLPRGSRFECTCGWMLKGAELDAYLRELGGRPVPVSIRCVGCGGVAVSLST